MTIILNRRSVLIGAAATLAMPSIARAAFPERPISLMHGFAAGSNLDIGARIIAHGLSKHLNQTVLVDPKPGASGVTASAKLAGETPDGYTLILLTAGHAVAAATRKQLPYDTLKDFSYVSLIYDNVPFCLLTHPDHPARTVQDIVAMSKEKPMTFATSGVGQTTHLAMELLIAESGAKLRHVPYKDISQATLDLGAKRVDFVISGLTVANAQVKTGAVRPIGVTSKERSFVNPEIPTLAEQGLPGFDVVTYTGVAAPAGLPPEIHSMLEEKIKLAIAEPDYEQHMRISGGVAKASTSAELRGRFAADIDRWNKVVDEAGIPRT